VQSLQRNIAPRTTLKIIYSALVHKRTRIPEYVAVKDVDRILVKGATKFVKGCINVNTAKLNLPGGIDSDAVEYVRTGNAFGDNAFRIRPIMSGKTQHHVPSCQSEILRPVICVFLPFIFVQFLFDHPDTYCRGIFSFVAKPYEHLDIIDNPLEGQSLPDLLKPIFPQAIDTEYDDVYPRVQKLGCTPLIEHAAICGQAYLTEAGIFGYPYFHKDIRVEDGLTQAHDVQILNAFSVWNQLVYNIDKHFL
jgi:hypothetical protein